jgi:hypothetical protein
MTVFQLSQALGARVLVTFSTAAGSVAVYCLVEDVRTVFGRVDFLVSPESGTGRGWVSMDRIERTGAGVCHFPPATK